MTWYCMVSKSPGSSCIDAMVIGNPSISPRESQKNWPWVYNSVKSSLLSRQRHHLSSIVRYLRRENARIMIFFQFYDEEILVMHSEKSNLRLQLSNVWEGRKAIV